MIEAAGYWPYLGQWQYSFPNGAWLAIAAAVLLLVAAIRSYRKGQQTFVWTLAVTAVAMLATSVVVVIYSNRTLAVNLSSLPYGVSPFRPVAWTVTVAGLAWCVLLVVLGASAQQRNAFVAAACLLALPATSALLMQARLMLELNDVAALRVTYSWLAEAILVVIVAIGWVAIKFRERSPQEVTD